jgi:hypothetical protein
MSIIFVKINAFFLNGLGGGSSGPIIKEIPDRNEEDTVRTRPLVFTDYETRKVG